MKPPFLKEKTSLWVQNTLQNLSLRQKIGQLFQVAAFSRGDEFHENKIEGLIRDYHIGGLTFFQGTVEHQRTLIERYQNVSKVPLFINIDAEWGLAMRLDDQPQLPYLMTMGALKATSRNYQLIRQVGESIARHCKAVGVQSPLAPVADVNVSAQNPVISFRSFGEDPLRVAKNAAEIMQGLQAHKILAVAKHFPGHGDTQIDSHLQLPVIHHDKKRLLAVELKPFKTLISSGVGAIMTAHIHVPAYDDTFNLPATLSSRLITGLLREQLGFEGLIITDAMDMKGITTHYESVEADLMALKAGNDLITNSRTVPESINAVESAVVNGDLSVSWLDEKVKRILAMKKWAGLDQWEPRHMASAKDLSADYSLNAEIAERSLTLLPPGKKPLTFRKYVCIQIICEHDEKLDKSMAHHLKLIKNSGGADHFYQELSEVQLVEKSFVWSLSEGLHSLKEFTHDIHDSEHILLSFHNVNIKPHQGFGLPHMAKELIEALGERCSIVCCFFGNPYALDLTPGINKFERVLLTYQENKAMHRAVIKYLQGSLAAEGELPISLQAFKN